ncbi:MAG: ATP-binding protein [Janthinobacterium lividum]
MAVERRRAEQALRRRAGEFEALVENVSQLAWMAEPDGRVFWYNRRWYAYTGTDLATMQGWGWRDVHRPDQVDAIVAEVSAHWARGVAWEGVYALGGADGRFRPFLTRAEPIRDAAGRLVRWFGTNTDISAQLEAEQRLRELNDTLEQRVADEVAERLKTQEQLRQAQKMEAVGQLTGGLAHDFNNLLTGITGSMELLRARIAQGRTTELERYLLAAEGAARRAAALTHRLLAFSRRQTLSPQVTDVERLAAGMEELVRRTVGPAIEVRFVAGPALWRTLVDQSQLENALLNLCINARDAMPDGGRITVETANRRIDAADGRDLPPGEYVSLAVSDTGSGMTAEVMAKAFDPFFTTKPLGEGTGLGLSMIYGFTQQSGGQARIHSVVGRGTTVRLFLPRHLGAEEAVEEGAGPASAAPRAAPGATVVVVDDEATVRMLVAEVLGELGYRTLEAGDGAAGLRLLEGAGRVDLLVTDVGLPGGLNGRQVADAARRLRPGLKVLFITGYAEAAVVGHGHLDAGMHVLTKPFTLDTLGARVKELVG